MPQGIKRRSSTARRASVERLQVRRVEAAIKSSRGRGRRVAQRSTIVRRRIKRPRSFSA